MRKLFLARGIEDDHYWVVEEMDGGLADTGWRIERERDGVRISHADDVGESNRVNALGVFAAPDAALKGLEA